VHTLHPHTHTREYYHKKGHTRQKITRKLKQTRTKNSPKRNPTSCAYTTPTHPHTHTPTHVTFTGWRTPIGVLIFIGHFPQKSPVTSSFFAKTDLQLKTSNGSLPPIGCLVVIGHFAQKSPIISGFFAQRDLQLKASSPPYAILKDAPARKQK